MFIAKCYIALPPVQAITAIEEALRYVGQGLCNLSYTHTNCIITTKKKKKLLTLLPNNYTNHGNAAYKECLADTREGDLGALDPLEYTSVLKRFIPPTSQQFTNN